MAQKIQAKRADAPQDSTVLAAQARYDRSTSAIEVLKRDEEVRRLRVKNILLEDEVRSLNEQLWTAEDRFENLEWEVEELQARAEEDNEDYERIREELIARTQELDILRTELFALNNTTADSTKILSEKLALARQVASLQPEIEDLRSQVAANHGLLSEKLALTRQVKTLEAELKDERLAGTKQAANRNTADEDAMNEELAKYKTQVDKLKKELARTKRDLETTQQDLGKAQRDLETSEKTDKADDSAHLEKVRELKAELAKEKRERAKAEKQVVQAEAGVDSEKAVLEDKLNQFRVKLKSTKEKLKETEAELLEARDAAANSNATKSNNPRKRPIAQVDPDAATGTPGNANAKRNKRATSVVGEKSSFSITPFLNRTANNPINLAGGRHQDDPVASIEQESSPTGERQRIKRPANTTIKKNVLGPASPSKSNPKVAAPRQRAAAKPKLAMVTEDQVLDENDENFQPRPPLSKTQQLKPLKQTLKPKSLASFSSFREGSAPPQQIQQKTMKRKILAGGAKTIFDDDEEGGALPFGTVNNRLGGQRAFGGIGARPLGGFGMLGIKKKGPIMVADGDFQFSPLKRDRRAAVAASS